MSTTPATVAPARVPTRPVSDIDERPTINPYRGDWITVPLLAAEFAENVSIAVAEMFCGFKSVLSSAYKRRLLIQEREDALDDYPAIVFNND